MNVAFYDLPRQELQIAFESEGMTPDGLRQFSLHAQQLVFAEGLDTLLKGLQSRP